jgi:hypothetical protein
MIAVGALCILALFVTSAYGQETVTFTVNSSYGSPDPAVGVHSYAKGTEITASVATPVPSGVGIRYACVGWKSKGDSEHLPSVGTTNSVTFTITKNIIMTWKWKRQYLLTVNVEPVPWAGHIEVWSEDQQTPADGYWDYKRVAQLEAVEDEGYDFAYWSGGSGAVRMEPTANPTVQKMRRPETITANFTPEPRNFTVISAQGEPVPAVGTYALHYDDLIEANCGENPYPAGEGAQYVCTGHDGTGDVSAGSETSISFYLHHNSSVTWLWQLQYVLIIDSLYGNPQGAGWYNAGDTASWSVTSPYPVSDGVRYFTDDPTSGEFLMDSPKSVTVSWRLQYRLTTAANPSEQGSVSPSGENWYNAGTEVALSATGNGIYGFLSWSGDLSGSVSPIDIIMDGAKSVTANFARPTLIIANPQGFDTPVPAEGTYTFDAGTSVTCSMSTPEVYGISWGTFTEGFESGMSGWTTGGAANWFLITEEKHSGSYSARSGGIGSNHSNYIERTFTIGPGGGEVSFWWKVSSRPTYHTLKFYIDGWAQATISGVTSWAQQTYSLAAGTRTLRWEYTKDFRSAQNLDRGWLDDIAVNNTLVPALNTRHVCTGYTGTGSCPSGSGTTVTFTIMTTSSITWNWTTQYKLTTSVNPAGWGTVTVSPVQDWYDEGSSVQLTAILSAEIYTFSNWSGDLTGSENPTTIIMNKTKNITADFIPTPRAVAVSSLYGSPNPPPGTTYYPNGTSVTVSCGPTPYAGPAGAQYVNTGWTGGSGDIPATGSASSYGPFTITQNCAITWTWNTQYQLTTAVNPAGSGTVTPGSGSWHDAGAVISCTASPMAGWRWLEWGGNLTGTENPKDLTMDRPKSITANFFRPTLTVSNPQGYGVPDPAAGEYSCGYGTSVTVSCGPTPYPGTTGTQYVCTGHTGTGDVIGGFQTSISFVITMDSSVTWLWQTQYYLITNVSPPGGGTVMRSPEGAESPTPEFVKTWGGSVACGGSPSPTFTNCNISDNWAGWYGGGIACGGSSSATFTNCNISGNSAHNVARGGGVSCYNSSPTFTNCAITSNTARGTYGGYGGGVYCSSSNPTFRNSIIWGNTAYIGNQIYVDTDCSVTLSYSCYANGATDVAGPGTVTPTNSITSNPLFVDAGNGNYHLQGTSPCIDIGNNSYVPAGVTTDLDGNPRIQNGTVDLGAYEYQP